MESYNHMRDTEAFVAPEKKEAQGEASSLTMEYVLTRIDRIIEDNAHVHEAIETIAQLEPMDQSPMSQMPDSRGEAIAKTVAAREETNRRLLDMLQGMYDDLKPKRFEPAQPADKASQLKMAVDALVPLEMDECYSSELVQSLINRIFPEN